MKKKKLKLEDLNIKSIILVKDKENIYSFSKIPAPPVATFACATEFCG